MKLCMALLAWLSLPAMADTLYLNYSHQPDATAIAQRTISIVDAHAVLDLTKAKAQGTKLFAYISLVELAKGSPAADLAAKRSVPVIGKNTDWNSLVLDVRTTAWQDYLLEDAAAPAFARGFDGLFFDTADSVARIEGDRAAAERSLIATIAAIKARWPTKLLILNRGFDLVPTCAPHLHGVLIESVIQAFDPSTRRYHAVEPDGRAWLDTKLAMLRALKLPVYAVDYVKPSDPALAKATAAKLRTLGCVPFVSTPGLTGRVLAD
jgi:polysaccharide biosynthesis protein PelA